MTGNIKYISSRIGHVLGNSSRRESFFVSFDRKVQRNGRQKIRCKNDKKKDPYESVGLSVIFMSQGKEARWKSPNCSIFF